MRQSKMTATMMAKTYRSFLFLLLVLCIHYTTVAKHVYSDSFPTNDEFDFSILDVYNVHGSPYGGFGRATRSRMAALPLQLPGTVGEYNEQDKEMYMEVRDGDGRLFACRVYHEDELTPSSLAESMFNTAQLSAVASHRYEEDIVENQTEDKETQDSPGEETDTGLTDEAKNEEQVHRVLNKLNGICTQVHKGWWSYEWCHGAKVTQFHVHVEKGKVQQIQTESVTNLGVYASSKVYTEGDPEDKKEVNRIVAEKIKEIEGESDEDEPKELAVVVHEFEDGAMCEETGKPRRTQVKLKCCPLKSMNRLRRAVLFNGHPVASNIAAITKMQETSVCNYSIEVCTPVLCEGLAEAFEGNSLVAKEGTNNDNKLVTTPFGSPEKRENESIREMLAGTLRNVCLTFQNGGWWVYEICHGKQIRQFHEAVQFDAKSGSYSRVPESIHILGKYSKDLENFPNEDEPKYVTTPPVEKDKKIGVVKSAGIKHDVGAYFVQEYTDGDVCDHRDVTDSAGFEDGIARATTLRYFCGEKLEVVRVNEDSTCHYVIDIRLPVLCEHKLFKEPVAKKQVIKCLPVDEI